MLIPISRFLLSISVLAHCLFLGCGPRKTLGSQTKAESSSDDLTVEKAPPKIPRLEGIDGEIISPEDFGMSEEAAVADDVTGTYLSLPKGVSGVGPAFAVYSTRETGFDPLQQSLRVFLPVVDPLDPKLVILYRAVLGSKVNYGLIPRSQLEIGSDHVSFLVPQLGIFQGASTPELISSGRLVTIDQSPSITSRITSLLKVEGATPFARIAREKDLLVVQEGQTIHRWTVNTEANTMTAKPSLPLTGSSPLDLSVQGGLIHFAAIGTGLSTLFVPEEEADQDIRLANRSSFANPSAMALAQHQILSGGSQILLLESLADFENTLRLSRLQRGGGPAFSLLETVPILAQSTRQSDMEKNLPRLAVFGNRAFVLLARELIVFELTAEGLRFVSRLTGLQEASQIQALSLDRALVYEKDRRLLLLDFKGTPRILRTLDGWSGVRGMMGSISSFHIVTVDRKHFEFDLTDPFQWLTRDTQNLEAEVTAMFADDELLLLSMGAIGMKVIWKK